ncbi:MAG: sodium:calcium antiporter [Candidatus Hydrogenedentota bacterium]|nr:MAG: sodium:calcium antiporter [Candidatus Hydrogenedentota bacterium]
MFFSWFNVGIGFLGLWLGAEWLVKGSVSIAARLRVSKIVIGLTVVAFATSAPELAVSLTAAFRGNPTIAMGNVVGSNVCNILLILGGSALFSIVPVGEKSLRREFPVLFAATAAIWGLIMDGEIGRGDGLLLVSAFFFVLGGSVYLEKRERREAEPEVESGFSVGIGLLVAGVGLAALLFGANRFLAGAVAIARHVGISERVIGLTLVAVGTSLPEVATSVAASIRKESDIILGNVVGSNIFNLLNILGFTALFHPFSVEKKIVFLDYPLMLVITLVLWLTVLRKRRVGRKTGGVMLAGYLLYVFFLMR